MAAEQLLEFNTFTEIKLETQDYVMTIRKVEDGFQRKTLWKVTGIEDDWKDAKESFLLNLFVRHSNSLQFI